MEILTTVPEFAAIEREWNELALRLGNPLLTHEYFAACIEAYRPRRMAVFVLRDSDRIQAIAPLYLTTYAGIPGLRRLKLLSQPEDEPSGLLYRDEASLETLLRMLADSKFPFKLSRLDANSAEAEALRAVAHDRGLLVEQPASPAMVALLPDDFADLERRMAKSNRSDLRRYRKRAERCGPVELEVETPDERDVDRALNEVFRIEGSGWKRRAGSAVLSLPHKERFLRAYGKAAVRRGRLRIFSLKIGGERVAVRLADTYADRLWDHKIGYDERWRSCAPGILLTHETLRYGCSKGFVAHEFIGKAEPWQKNWPSTERRLCTMNYYPPGFASFGLYAMQSGWDRLRSSRAKRLLKRIARVQ